MAAAAVIMFDLDGTLSDSAPGILSGVRHAFAANGLPPLDERTERTLLGPSLYDSLPPLIGDASLADVIGAYRDYYGRDGMFNTSLYDGIVPVLTELQAAGVRLAVATSKAEPYAVPVVEHLGIAQHFEVIGGDDLEGSRGNKTLVIGAVLARLGQPDPSTVVMVGDRKYDVEGARAHGIATVGAGWGYAAPGELAAAQPLAVCPRPADLAGVFGLDGVGAAAS
jgi:phosphoglycolate phosphatase